MSKVVLLTGGSSGIGLETAAALAARGCKVYELSRRDTSGSAAVHIGCDITDEAAVAAAVKTVFDAEGRIDILINNAGMGISGAVEFTENSEAKRLMEVNLFGGVNLIKAVLPIMRKAGRGRIINLSSVAAPVAIPFQAWYSISKAGINALTLALRSEVRPFGISVAAIMPGDMRTGFTAARKKSAAGDEIYSGRISRSVAVMEHDEQSGTDPSVAGRFIAGIALMRRVRPLYAIGLKNSFFVMLSRLLPASLCSRIVGMIYAK